MVCHRDQYWDPYYSYFLLTTCIKQSYIAPYTTLQMIPTFYWLKNVFKKSANLTVTSKFSVNGFVVTNSDLTLGKQK